MHAHAGRTLIEEVRRTSPASSNRLFLREKLFERRRSRFVGFVHPETARARRGTRRLANGLRNTSTPPSARRAERVAVKMRRRTRRTSAPAFFRLTQGAATSAAHIFTATSIEPDPLFSRIHAISPVKARRAEFFREARAVLVRDAGERARDRASSELLFQRANEPRVSMVVRASRPTTSCCRRCSICDRDRPRKMRLPRA